MLQNGESGNFYIVYIFLQLKKKKKKNQYFFCQSQRFYFQVPALTPQQVR